MRRLLAVAMVLGLAACASFGVSEEAPAASAAAQPAAAQAFLVAGGLSPATGRIQLNPARPAAAAPAAPAAKP